MGQADSGPGQAGLGCPRALLRTRCRGAWGGRSAWEVPALLRGGWSVTCPLPRLSLPLRRSTTPTPDGLELGKATCGQETLLATLGLESESHCSRPVRPRPALRPPLAPRFTPVGALRLPVLPPALERSGERLSKLSCPASRGGHGEDRDPVICVSRAWITSGTVKGTVVFPGWINYK